MKGAGRKDNVVSEEEIKKWTCETMKKKRSKFKKKCGRRKMRRQKRKIRKVRRGAKRQSIARKNRRALESSGDG